MTLAHALTGDHVICYRLSTDSGQIKLRLWEPIRASNCQAAAPLPYLYAANFSFKTWFEAERFLREHLLANGAFDVPESDFPPEGQIAILPYPTWGLDPS